MKSVNKIQQLDKIRILLDKYFDATATPDEVEILKASANDVVSGEISCPDSNLKEQLRFINAIEGYSEKILSAYSESAPSDLETRLETHISSLAAGSAERKRRPFLAKFLPYSAAAVAAAIVAVAGIKYFSPQEDGNVAQQILIAYNSTASIEATVSESIPSLIASSAISSPHTPSQNTKHTKRTPKPSTSAAASSPLPSESPTLNSQPSPTTLSPFSISEETFRVMPAGINARIETAHILVQPISTLSQSINNIYESVAAVSEALSGVSSSFEAVSNSLALLSEPI